MRGGHQLLTGVSLSLYRGQVLGVMGDSGAGKSTLLRALLGLEAQRQASLEWCDVQLTAQGEGQRFAWVPQDCHLFPHLTVQENICFSAPYLSLSAEALAERLASLSERLSLTTLLGRRPAQLSGGQRQRVALARALFTRAPVLLLDEPLAHLELAARLALRSLICALVEEEELACLWVSHDPEEALEVSAQLALLHQGTLEGPLSVREALTAPPSQAFAERFGQLTWFPITPRGEGWGWGPPWRPALWSLPDRYRAQASAGGWVGVRGCAWTLSRERSAGPAALPMRVTRCRAHPWGVTLELAATEGALQMTVQGLMEGDFEHESLISLTPRELVFVQGGSSGRELHERLV